MKLLFAFITNFPQRFQGNFGIALSSPVGDKYVRV